VPACRLSSTDYASVDVDGKMTNKNATDDDQTVTLTASYTVGDVTKTASKVVTLAKRTLTEIIVYGNETINSGESASYTCTATWSYGDSTEVMPVWSLSSNDFASVDANGTVTNRNATDDDRTVTLNAVYTFGGVETTATKVITLVKRSLMSITIEGDDEIPNEGVATYVCKATWSDGSTTVVMPEWKLSSDEQASVDAGGKVTNANVTDDKQTVTLTATYTVGDIKKEMSLDITLKGVPQPTQILELCPGWNMVMLEKPLKNKPDGVQKFLALKPMAWDVAHSAIVICGDKTAVKAGIGYWIYSRISQSVELVQDTETPVSQVNLKHGWNFVGMTEDAAWPDSATAIWTWRNGRFIPVEKEDLRVGCSYWVYIN
jgi:hypothetical protein